MLHSQVVIILFIDELDNSGLTIRYKLTSRERTNICDKIYYITRPIVNVPFIHLCMQQHSIIMQYIYIYIYISVDPIFKSLWFLAWLSWHRFRAKTRATEPRICSVWRNHKLILHSSLMTYHWLCSKGNTTSPTDTAYPSGVHPQFLLDLKVSA